MNKENSSSKLRNHKSSSQQVIVTISLILFNLIFVLGPVLGFVGLVFGLFVTSGAFIISPIIVLFKTLFGNQHLFEWFFSIMLAGIGLLILPPLIKGSKYGLELLEKYFHWNVRVVKGEE